MDQDGAQLVRKTESSIPTRKASGARTPAGKNRIKHNAVKHGIFSKVALLKNESRSEFESLLRGLHDDFRPEGKLEGILVEKLATNLWRRRGVLIAEVAEIENGTTFLAWDEKQRQGKDLEAPRVRGSEFVPEVTGLMEKMENPQILERCLEVPKVSDPTVERRVLRDYQLTSEVNCSELAETDRPLTAAHTQASVEALTAPRLIYEI